MYDNLCHRLSCEYSEMRSDRVWANEGFIRAILTVYSWNEKVNYHKKE
jgi:hypothetical protein